METSKILLSHCCKNNLYIEQMDIETAFFNGHVKSEVYVNEPKGYETGENKVYKLKRALHGLGEAPRACYDCFYKGYPHYNSEKDTIPGIPKNFGRCSGMQNDDLSRYFQLPPPPLRTT